MNVTILGAGTVGTSIAELLCQDNHNISLVDSSSTALAEAEERLDVQTVYGSVCDAAILFQAGVQSADLCLCVTNEDEANLISASIAKTMGARRSVARIFNPTYRDLSTFDYQRHFGISRLLSLEHLTALELAKVLRTPELLTIENLAHGSIEVQEFAVEAQSKAVGVPLRELKMSPALRVGLISRNNKVIIPRGNDLIEAEDHLTLIGTNEEIRQAKKLFEQKSPPKLNVMIAGGGEVGFHLARFLELGRFNVSLLENDESRCEYIASKLAKTTILKANASKLSELEEARVGNADVFVAATGDDEDNIMCCVEAKELGAERIVSVIRRPDYANVISKLGIDAVVSPREILAHQILGMVEAGPILSRSPIAAGEAAVCEIEVSENAPITQAPLKDLELKESLIVAIDRNNYVHVAGANDQLRTGDIAVALVRKENLSQLIEQFETST